jgi:RNA polymerase sigma factor (sigma-70 family)
MRLKGRRNLLATAESETRLAMSDLLHAHLAGQLLDERLESARRRRLAAPPKRPHRTPRREADHRAADGRRGPPADPGELERVVLAAAGGDVAAWRTLVERFTARIRAVARRHGLRPQDADDVVQTTWLRLLEHLDGVREPGAVVAWLATTARRESLHVLAKSGRERPTDDALLPEEAYAPEPAQGLIATERRSAVRAALDALPERQRALLHALFVEPEPSYVDIAAVLGIPIGSIGPTRGRSLDRLRRDRGLRAVVDARD